MATRTNASCLQFVSTCFCFVLIKRAICYSLRLLTKIKARPTAFAAFGGFILAAIRAQPYSNKLGASLLPLFFVI